MLPAPLCGASPTPPEPGRSFSLPSPKQRAHTGKDTMPGMQWGRLQVDVNCRLRRGAWYRVKEVASLNAVLDVNRQLLAVPHYLIQVISAPPRRWSVVPRPQNARVLPHDWGATYGVCPSSRERA